MRAAELESRVRELGPWFHDLELQGVRTAPDHPLGPFLSDLWQVIESAFPERMEGLTVLDVGCNAGFYSLKLHQRGAQVTGIDHDPRYLQQARFAAEVSGADIEFVQMDVYEVGSLGRTFDYVLFMGVLYHLRHPLLGLERVAALARRRLVFQTLVRGATGDYPPAADYAIDEEEVFRDERFPRMYFVENRYAGDPTNWWIPNDAGAAAMVRSVGMRIDTHAAPGIYFCSPRADS